MLKTNEIQQGCQATISDTESKVDEQVKEPDETVMPNNNSTWESDFDSFNFRSAIAENLLELTENLRQILQVPALLVKK